MSMQIAGFLPFTLSDYPGCAAAMVFTQGCNFQCPFCHNGGLIAAEEANIMPEKAVLDRLRKRMGQLRGVVVSGGEPTIQPDLADFLQQLKAMHYQVKLDTNGSRPEVLANLIEQELVDYIAMDVKAPLEQYERLAGVEVAVRELEESIALIAWSGLPHHFRTTHVPTLLSQAQLRDIQAMLPSKSPHVTQTFIPENAWDPQLRNEQIA
jgi:pyruvate formate lyase activating enzyme